MTPEQQRAIAIAQAKLKIGSAPKAPPPFLAGRTSGGAPMAAPQTGPVTGPAQYSPRTRTQMPETVTAADGTTFYLEPATGQYIDRTGMGMEARQRFDRGQYGAGTAFQAGAANGFTMGAGDEVAGAVLSEKAQMRGRAVLDAAREEYPGMTATGEIAGSLAVPLPMGKASGVKQAVAQGAKLGALFGGGYAFMNAEGGLVPRAVAGLAGAISGGIFGATVPVVMAVGTKAYRKIAARPPNMTNLRAAKNAAYDAADKAGITFSGAEMAQLEADVKTALAQTNYVPGTDTQTDAALTLLGRWAGKDMKLGQLDKLRQDLFRRVKAAPNEVGIYEAIDAIDDLIASNTSADDLMTAARIANSRFKKAELLDDAMTRAERETGATGSGGNLNNKFRQAVVKILNDPKRAKWFNASERAAMEKMAEGGLTGNALRLVGKLSPGGNGLMMALNLMAGAQFGAPALAAAGVGAGAKAIADGMTSRKATQLISRVAGGPAPLPPAAYSYGVPQAAGPVMDALPNPARNYLVSP
jgi:hypothetical protein